MIIDSSSVLAIFYQEAGCEELLSKLLAAPKRIISACTLVECHMVVGGRSGEAGSAKLARLITNLSVEIVAFTPEQAEVARLAFLRFLRFGKGRHPAKLNFGDCLTYALAVSSGEALLFIGNDFGRTDVLVA